MPNPSPNAEDVLYSLNLFLSWESLKHHQCIMCSPVLWPRYVKHWLKPLNKGLKHLAAWRDLASVVTQNQRVTGTGNTAWTPGKSRHSAADWGQGLGATGTCLRRFLKLHWHADNFTNVYNGLYIDLLYFAVIYKKTEAWSLCIGTCTSSTAQGGGGSFKDRTL